MMKWLFVVIVGLGLYLTLMPESTCQFSMIVGSTLATDFGPVYGLRFSFTDNLFMILSRSRTDILNEITFRRVSLREMCISCCWDVLKVR